MMLFGLLFGFVSSSFYLYDELLRVINRPNMEGYFNVFGMFFVICAVIIVFTNLQSLIFNIQVISFVNKKLDNDLIDENEPDENVWLSKVPNVFLLRSNMIFSLTFLFNGILIFFHAYFFEKYQVRIFILILSSIQILFGVLMTLDFIKINKMVKKTR